MLPVTVGTSSSEKTMEEPKHSASTDKSIRLTDAADGTRSATEELGTSYDNVQFQVEMKYNLSQEEAERYMKQYWK